MREAFEKKLQALRGVLEAVAGIPDEDAVHVLRFCVEDTVRRINREAAKRVADVSASAGQAKGQESDNH